VTVYRRELFDQPGNSMVIDERIGVQAPGGESLNQTDYKPENIQ
jgi:hypothetical protein